MLQDVKFPPSTETALPVPSFSLVVPGSTHRFPFRRVNLLGGAGAGKTTTAYYLAHRFKASGYNCSYVEEYVKDWTYIDRLPKDFDQVTIYGKQQNEEQTKLRKEDLIVCDSPIMLSHLYARKYVPHLNVHDQLLAMARQFEAVYPSINIMMVRGDKEYKQTGRFGSRDSAVEMDEMVEEFAKQEYGDNLLYADWLQPEHLFRLIVARLQPGAPVSPAPLGPHQTPTVVP